MGYNVARILRVDFEDEASGESAFMRFRSISYGQYAALVEENSSAAAVKVLGETLVEWNFESDGEPVPTTAEGIDSLDPTLRDYIIVSWFRALRGEDAQTPLARRSSAPVAVPSMSPDDL